MNSIFTRVDAAFEEYDGWQDPQYRHLAKVAIFAAVMVAVILFFGIKG